MFPAINLSTIDNLNKTILGTSCVSFLEAEMQICSEQGCTCDQFESMVKEYTHLLKSFNPLKSAEQKLVDALQTIEKLQNADASKENEIQILRNENEKLTNEVREKERKTSNFVEEIDNLKKNLSDAEVTKEVLKQQNSNLIYLLALREAYTNTTSEERNSEEIVNGQISSDDSGNDEQKELNIEKCMKCQTEKSKPRYNFITGDNKSGKQCQKCYRKTKRQ
uniref:Uncharacterized protein n=1 Tax=Panagrolaimus davidi TaxID=227884 RepID=A0A914QGP0_9BILA